MEFFRRGLSLLAALALLCLDVHYYALIKLLCLAKCTLNLLFVISVNDAYVVEAKLLEIVRLVDRALNELFCKRKQCGKGLTE